MSRRREEFAHRTSVFEGAFRAWSHLGGLDPQVLRHSEPSEVDPLTNPIVNDERVKDGNRGDASESSHHREYPYEPLPRAGLQHPFVQAIFPPWMGTADADPEALQLGLSTLRTWWQHRRRGETNSSKAALASDKMQQIVDSYTRHFFQLAHCLVVNDDESAPRTLQNKLKEEQVLLQQKKSSSSDGDGGMGPGVVQLGTDGHLSPLERLHEAQRRQHQHAVLPVRQVS